MPSIKCAECGHRTLLPTVLAICPNCGAAFPARSATQGQSEESHAPEGEAVPGLVSPSSYDSVRQCPLCEAPLPNPLNTANCPHCGTSLTPMSRSLIRSELRSATSTIRPQPPMLDVPPDIYLHLPSVTMPERPDPFAAPPPQLPSAHKRRYPFGFPRRPPDLEGIIVQVQSQLENQAPPNLSMMVLRQLRDMIWAVNGPETQQKEQVLVTMMRIQTGDGVQQDARLEGYQTGANPSLGDTVSLWGWQRKGILRVYRGYNHTTRGVISTTALSSPLPVLLLLAGLLTALLLLSHRYHIPLLPHWP